MNIVFVCTGNTCRSPMAEAIFRKKTENYSKYCTVSSCGLAASVGDTASENAAIIMAKRGLDISSHRSRQINQYIIDDADFIICLAQSHYNVLYPLTGDKTVLLGSGIPDPYMGNETVYYDCADCIENEIDKLLNSDLFLELSEMTHNDASDAADIEKANFSEPWSRDSFTTQLSKDYSVNFSARYLGKTIGYICCDDVLGEVNVGTIAVHNDFRRRHIGTLLINKTIDYCIKNNSALLTLEVRESNTPAINLYLKTGFEILGKRKNFYSKPTEDALIMTKYFNGDTNENSSN